MNSEKSIVFSAISTNLLAKIVKNVIPFLIAILIIRLLSVREFGTFSLFLSFLSIFGGLSFGIHHIYQRYIAIYAENKRDMSRVIKFTFVTTAARIGIFLGIIAVLYIFKSLDIINLKQLNFPYVWLAVITCVAVIFKLVFQEGLLSGYLDHKYFNLIDISILLLKCLIIIILRPETVIGFIYIWLYLEILRIIFLFARFSYLIRQDQAGMENSGEKHLEYGNYYDYGKYFIFATIASQILAFDIDNYFLAYFIGNEAVGMYSFATKITFALAGFAPVNIMFNVTTPQIIKDYEQHRNKERLLGPIDTLFKLNILVYAIMVVFFLININFILNIVFKGKYASTVPYILAFIPISFLPVIKNTFEPVSRGIGKSKVYLFTLVSAMLNLVGNIILIPLLGIIGAIISTGLAISLQSVAFVVFAMKEINFAFDGKFLLKLLINIIPVVLLGYYLQSYILNSIVSAIILNIMILIITVMIFKYNKFFSDEESSFINSFLPLKFFVF